jgi:glucose-1-phosphate thymidylyltransferase
MIYYPLSTLMLCGIRDIALISRPSDIPLFKALLGTGEDFGISITYLEQPEPKGLPEAYLIAEDFIDRRKSVLILGDNIFLGPGLGSVLEDRVNRKGSSIFAFPVMNASEYGVVEFDADGKVQSIEEKPVNPKSNYAIPGIYFLDANASKYARDLKPSTRGELEIVDLLRMYISTGELNVDIFQRGIGWMDAGTVDSLYAATELVEVLQKRQGLRFSVPEEISWRNGWISNTELAQQATKYRATDYGIYLDSLLATEK